MTRTQLRVVLRSAQCVPTRKMCCGTLQEVHSVCILCSVSLLCIFLFFIQLFCLSCFSFLLFRYSSIFTVYFEFSFLHFVSFPLKKCFTCFVCFILLETLLHRVMGYTGVWGTSTTVQCSRSILEISKTFKPFRNLQNRKKPNPST